jgi:hypothetical protein
MTDPNLLDDMRRYWDELVQGKSAKPGELDPQLASLIQQLHAQRDVVPPPDPAYARHLREDLMNQTADAGTVPLIPPSVAVPAPNGRTQPRSWRASVLPGMESRTHRRWRLGPFATAVLVLLVLGLVYVVFGPGRADNSRPAGIPAVVFPTSTTIPPTPTPVATEETLLQVTIPADALPHGEGVSSGLAHFSIPPGTRSTWEPYCCPGPMVEYVLEGTYTVRAEAAIQLVRADGTVEEVPAGTEVVLGPGDGLISRNETVVEAANTGATPVELLNWVLIEKGDFGGHSLLGWVDHMADVQGPLAVPAGPATLLLRRVELAPDATFPAPAAGTLRFGVTLPNNAAGTPVAADLGQQSDGTIRTVGAEAITIYILTLEPAGGATGSPVASSPTP